MSTSQVLEHLYSLNTSSPNFTRYLYCLIQCDEKEQYLSGLRGSDLTRLVDFLGGVRTFLLAPFQLMKQAPQVLSATPVNDEIYRRCLHKLQAICSQNTTLPSSYTISGDLARVGDNPVASGGFADVWEGEHNSIKVCIKCPRITMRTRKIVEKVNIRRWYLFSVN